MDVKKVECVLLLSSQCTFMWMVFFASLTWVFFSICRSQWNWRKKSKGNRISILKIITFDGFFLLIIIVVVVVVFFSRNAFHVHSSIDFFLFRFQLINIFDPNGMNFCFFSCFIYVCLFVCFRLVLMIKCKNPFTHWQR